MIAKPKKPSVFIGSSTKGEPIARAVEKNLEFRAETLLWQHMFPQGKATLESLVHAADGIDFAVLVLTPDDLTESKGEVMSSPRDNVLFELGLFMGRLGRERTFAVYSRDEKLKLPTDLSGITWAEYSPHRNWNNLSAEVSPACTPILVAITNLGPLRRKLEVNPQYDSDLAKLDGKWLLPDIISDRTIVIVVGDGVVSELLDRPTAAMLRDEINQRGQGATFRRAIIIGHFRWTKEHSLHKNPTISIGGKPANELSEEILQARKKTLNKDRWQEGEGGWGALVPAAAPVGPRVALWGDSAAATRRAVGHYIERPEGLREFLEKYAGWQ
jgi:hypothetical protein